MAEADVSEPHVGLKGTISALFLKGLAEIIARQFEVPTDMLDVHPNIANIYCKRVKVFTVAMHTPDDGRIAAEELCSLINVEHRQKLGEVGTKRSQPELRALSSPLTTPTLFQCGTKGQRRAVRRRRIS